MESFEGGCDVVEKRRPGDVLGSLEAPDPGSEAQDEDDEDGEEGDTGQEEDGEDVADDYEETETGDHVLDEDLQGER